MSESIPDWITNDFLTQVLKKEKGKENAIVTDFIAVPAIPPGNNYGSNIIRIKVEYKCSLDDDVSNTVSLILKAELTQGPVKEIFNLVSGEPRFYYEFIPEAKRLMDMSFVPKSYTSPGPNDVILEDLKEQGFEMADRQKQLDYDHCHLYMIAAAKLHAVSVAVYKQHPEQINAFGEEQMFSNEAMGAPMFKTSIKYGMEVLVKKISKIDRFKKYAKVIEDSTPHLWDMMVETHWYQEGLKTINQGDPWVTNMMFKYDEKGKVADIKLLDFQCLRYASPINDVVFFIWTSANNNVKKHHLDKLYHIYLTTLNDKLEEFNFPERLTYNEFMKGLKMSSAEALYWCGVPTITHPDPVDFGIFQRHQENGDDKEIKMFFKNLYSQNFCTNQLPDILESLELSGVFEYLQSKQRASE